LNYFVYVQLLFSIEPPPPKKCFPFNHCGSFPNISYVHIYLQVFNTISILWLSNTNVICLILCIKSIRLFRIVNFISLLVKIVCAIFAMIHRKATVHILYLATCSNKGFLLPQTNGFPLLSPHIGNKG